MKQIPGGATAPKGFRAWGVCCGVESKRADKRDLALILSDQECAAAVVYIINRVKAAPLYVTMEYLEDGTAQGVATSSGNANAYCPMSHEYAKEMARLTAQATGRVPANFVVASTGIIGQALNITAIRAGMPEAAAGLITGPEGSDAAARVIMTTDTVRKELTFACSIDGRAVTLGTTAGGSGMIHPNMDTMPCFVTTDYAITREMLSEALREMVPRIFNRMTMNGDTSTDDICVVLANGMADNPLIEWKDDGYAISLKTLRQLYQEPARAIAGDGEGASRLITCVVREARNKEGAECLTKAVVGSPLMKAAMFGADTNWGQVLCVMGYSKVPFRPEYVDISFSSAVGAVAVCRGGMGLDFDKETAQSIPSQDEVVIDVHLHEGGHEAACWGYDLAYEYVKINDDYRT